MVVRLMPLDAVDPVLITNFNCTSQDDFIDNFIKKDAKEKHTKNIIKTHVLVENDTQIVGYFSLFLDHIEVLTNKIEQQKWDLNQRLFPSVRIHAIGIDEQYQKQKYGKALLGVATAYCLDIAETAGCTFINLEATKDSQGFYEKYGFVKIRKINYKLTHMAIRTEDVE